MILHRDRAPAPGIRPCRNERCRQSCDQQSQGKCKGQETHRGPVVLRRQNPEPPAMGKRISAGLMALSAISPMKGASKEQYSGSSRGASALRGRLTPQAASAGHWLFQPPYVCLWLSAEVPDERRGGCSGDLRSGLVRDGAPVARGAPSDPDRIKFMVRRLRNWWRPATRYEGFPRGCFSAAVPAAAAAVML